MKLGKLLLAVVSTTVLFGALVSSASARNLEVSSQTVTSLWTRLSITSSAIGIVECEVKLSGSFHGRTFTKTVNSLIGYITEGTVLRCASGGATVNQASLPWHVKYRSFAGTLPNITQVASTVTGSEWNVREIFGLTCTARREFSSLVLTYGVSIGTVSSASVEGESRCEGGVETRVRFTASTANVTNGAGARLTIRLI